jgi:hypothetical protein
MNQTTVRQVILLLLLASVASTPAGQSNVTDLDKLSERVESYVRQKRPGWKHETALPPIPPGGQPSGEVSIHFWSSENCLTAELKVGGVSYDAQPVPCSVKLAIDRSPSATEARTRLSTFVYDQRGAKPTPLVIGDKGYVWNGSHVVFVKGKYTFWISGVVDLRVGDFTINREFTETWAKDIAEAIAPLDDSINSRPR